MNDVFDVAARVREIDPDYFILFDKKLDRFEVHHRRQGNTLAPVVPYPALDCRTVEYVLKTRIENFERLAREADRHNEALENRAARDAAAKAAKIVDEGIKAL